MGLVIRCVEPQGVPYILLVVDYNFTTEDLPNSKVLSM